MYRAKRAAVMAPSNRMRGLSALARIELLRGPRVDGDKSQQNGKGAAPPGQVKNETVSSTKNVRTKNKKSAKQSKPGAALQSTFLDRDHDAAGGDEEPVVSREPMSDGPSDEAEGVER